MGERAGGVAGGLAGGAAGSMGGGRVGGRAGVVIGGEAGGRTGGGRKNLKDEDDRCDMDSLLNLMTPQFDIRTARCEYQKGGMKPCSLKQFITTIVHLDERSQRTRNKEYDIRHYTINDISQFEVSLL